MPVSPPPLMPPQGGAPIDRDALARLLMQAQQPQGLVPPGELDMSRRTRMPQNIPLPFSYRGDMAQSAGIPDIRDQMLAGAGYGGQQPGLPGNQALPPGAQTAVPLSPAQPLDLPPELMPPRHRMQPWMLPGR